MSYLYCTDAQRFASTWPSTVALLGQAGHVEEDLTGMCFDFVLRADADGWLTQVEFEFVELSTLLNLSGADDLAARCSVEALNASSVDELGAALTLAIQHLMPSGVVG